MYLESLLDRISWRYSGTTSNRLELCVRSPVLFSAIFLVILGKRHDGGGD